MTASAAPTHKHAEIDFQIEGANGKARSVASQNSDHRTRAQNAQHRAGTAQQQAFGQQGTPQSRRGCAQSGANRQLAFAADRARQNQIGDIRARNDKDETDAASSTQRIVFAPDVIWSRSITASIW